MKTKIFLTGLLAILFLKVLPQEPVDINGYLIIEIDNEYYDGSGIRIVNANLKNTCSSIITPCPPTEYYPNIFANLYRGIYATSFVPNSYISIINCRFENNYRGLYLGGISNARITSNLFKIGAPFTENGGYGMYLDACTGYWIEDNDFTHDFEGRKGVGIVVNNSGTAPNQIYRNRFVSLEMGVSAQGNNRNPVTGTGLQILCNDFIDTDSDILITNPDRLRSFGIAAHQGADSPNPQHMAGNLFYIPNPIPDGDFDDINNEGENIIYFAPEIFDEKYRRLIPVDYTENTVTVKRVDVSDAWTYNDGCPCRLEYGGGGHAEEMKQQMAESRQQADAIQETLNLLIDAGNTGSLHWDVYMSTSPEAMQVYQQLMTVSPYLSDTVLSAAILKEDVLVDAMLRDIMVANPHTAKSDALMEKLDQRWMPLPDYMKAQILQGKNLVSVKEQAESRLAQYTLKKATALAKLSGLYHDNADSLICLYENDNTPSSKYKLAFLLLDKGESTQGMAILNNIPLEFNLDGQQLAEHQQLHAFYEIVAALYQQGKMIPAPDSLQLLSLAGIESKQAGLASVYARNILMALQLVDYQEPILLPDLLKSRAMAEAYSKLLNVGPPKNLIVSPIPARDFLVTETVLDTESKGMIEFTDASGRHIQNLTVSGPINRQIVDTRHWKPGWYIATLKTPAKTLESVKFIISD